MAADRLTPRGWIVAAVAALLALGLAAAGWRWWTERYTVTVEEDGGAVSRVVAATLSGTSVLTVARLSGVVQASAADTRFGGLLSSDQVVKAPFTVDYQLDLRRFGARDLHWNAQTRALVIDAPDVTIAPPNIDEGRRTLVRTRGILVTRGAGEELSRKVALGAERAAGADANRPERLAQARASARRALAALLVAPLNAAGLRVASVEVRFPEERGRATQRWDVSRSIPEVLGNGR